MADNNQIGLVPFGVVQRMLSLLRINDETMPPKIDGETEANLRKDILDIQNNSDLSAAEKAKKTQELMSLNWHKNSTQDLVEQPIDENLKPTYHDAELSILGCKHYKRGAKLQADCCGKWFTCRLCHDEACDHQIVRYNTKQMMCMHCQAVQLPKQTCESCEKLLAHYYCDICKLWDDEPSKTIYHCDRCKICRIGRGLGVDFIHCDSCGYCIAISMKDSHKCFERNLEQDCPICGEYLFTSREAAINMECGHPIHPSCFKEYTRSGAEQCPVCLRSLTDMSSRNQQIDAMLAQEKMPPEYDNFVSTILCNDCMQKCTVKYHFLYHKCAFCGGYNTNVLERKEVSPQSTEAGTSTTLTSYVTESQSPNEEIYDDVESVGTLDDDALLDHN